MNTENNALKKQISMNLLSSYLSTGISMIIGVILIPFLVKMLGKDAFGLIVLAESTIAFFELATIGMRLALSRHATFTHGQDKKEEFIGYLSTSRYVLLILAAIMLLIGSIISYNFPNIFHVPAIYTTQSKILFLLITLSFVITTINIVFWSVLYVKQRMDLISIATACGILIRGIGIILVFSILPKKYVSVVIYGIIYLIMICTREYIVYAWQKKIMPGLKLSIKYFNRDKIKELFAFGIFSTISHVASLFNENTINIIVNVFWGVGFNAVYAVGLKFPQLMKRVFLDSTWTLTSTFTDLAAKGDKSKLKSLFFVYTKLISFIAIPVCFILVFFAKPIILIWIGSDFILASRILQISIIPMVVALPFAVGECINNAYAKVRLPSVVAIVAAILNIALAIVFGKVFSLGLIGIALASAISTFLSSVLFQSYYSCKIAGFSNLEYWINAFLLPFAWASAVFLVTFLSVKSLNFNLVSFKSLILYSIFVLTASSAVYSFGAYKFLFDNKEKGYIKDIFKHLIRKA